MKKSVMVAALALELGFLAGMWSQRQVVRYTPDETAAKLWACSIEDHGLDCIPLLDFIKNFSIP